MHEEISDISECGQGLVYGIYKYYIGHIMLSNFSWTSLNMYYSRTLLKISYFNRLKRGHEVHNFCYFLFIYSH